MEDAACIYTYRPLQEHGYRLEAHRGVKRMAAERWLTMWEQGAAPSRQQQWWAVVAWLDVPMLGRCVTGGIGRMVCRRGGDGAPHEQTAVQAHMQAHMPATGVQAR